MSDMEQQESQPPRMLTPGEAAAILKITPRHVARLARSGRLHRVIIGSRTVRYTADSVAALINESSPKTATSGSIKTAGAGDGHGSA